MENKEALNSQDNSHVSEVHTEAHSWPHLPAIQGEMVVWFISNTAITTFIFLIIVFVVAIKAKIALASKKKSRLKLFFLNFIKFFDDYLRDSFGDKSFARNYFPLVVGIFMIILFGNLFGLAIDWLWASISPSVFYYLRPMHSDLNTTLVLAIITVVMFLAIWIKSNWFSHVSKWYFFNFAWRTFAEKCINVFVGWLHLIWVPSTLASLSLRLFWNIFAWIVLIWVISYLWAWMSQSVFELWRLLSIPFWFFEFFVAFVQAVVFAWLMISYFKQAKEESH